MNNKKARKNIRKNILNSSIKSDYSFIKILTGSDLSKRRLPVMSVESINPGPIIWLTSCVHGDEIGSTVVVQEIFKKIKRKGILKGKIYGIPIMNPSGFETSSRHIAMSEEDL